MMSAEPEREETERLPCLTMGSPHVAATKALAVDTFKVYKPSPPVPQESAESPSGDGNLTALSLRVCTSAAISDGVSPLTFRAISMPAMVTCSMVSENTCLNNTLASS